MAKHARDKLTRQLGEHATTVLIEGGQLMPDADEPDRLLWTIKSPSKWPKWARELWARRDMGGPEMTASEVAANPPTFDGLRDHLQEAFIEPIVDKALEILGKVDPEEDEDAGIQRATNGQLKALDREGE